MYKDRYKIAYIHRYTRVHIYVSRQQRYRRYEHRQRVIMHRQRTWRELRNADRLLFTVVARANARNNAKPHTRERMKRDWIDIHNSLDASTGNIHMSSFPRSDTKIIPDRNVKFHFPLMNNVFSIASREFSIKYSTTFSPRGIQGDSESSILETFRTQVRGKIIRRISYLKFWQNNLWLRKIKRESNLVEISFLSRAIDLSRLFSLLGPAQVMFQSHRISSRVGPLINLARTFPLRDFDVGLPIFRRIRRLNFKLSYCQNTLK